MTLRRVQFRGDGVFSHLLKKDGSQFCVAAEHAYAGLPKLPNGVYACKRRHSPHFGYDVFLITDVPGHDFMEIHIGNEPQVDSDGCVLLGREFFWRDNGGQLITMSRATFHEFMDLQRGISEFQLTVA